MRLLIGSPENNVKIASQEYNPETNFYTVHFDKELTVGQKYMFSLNYIGLLNDLFTGFYRSTYKDKEGNIK